MVVNKIRWGVIGTSRIGRVAVIPAIQAAHNSELVAVASRELEKAESFAAELSIPKAYSSYDALLDADDIDAIYIPLPNSMHCEWAIRAAEKGKHILVEKPLALNMKECQEMEAAANQYGVKLMEAFMYRFHPRSEKVLKMVQDGLVGELRYLHSAFTYRLTRLNNIRLRPDLGGGSLLDVGCYCVNISRTLAGAEPVEVQAYARWSQSGVDEQMSGTLRFSDGLVAQFNCALFMERNEVYEVAGTDGYLIIEAAFLPGKGDVTINEYRSKGEREQHNIKGANEYQLMVEEFADCIQQNRLPRYTASEAVLNMRVIEALFQSALLEGKPVKLY
jgi:D-xylose 1-dehydrogenase (NADP+, D-xylono-1,5-lactone-forming)